MPNPAGRILAPAAVAIYAAALGVFQASFPTAFAPSWLVAGPVGIAFAAALVGRRVGAVAAAAGTFAAGMLAGAGPGPAAILAAGALAEGLFTLWVTRRGLPFAPAFDHPTDAAGFAVLSAAAACVRAGVVAAAAAGLADPGDAFLAVAPSGWLGNLILGPLALQWFLAGRDRARGGELAAALAVVGGGTAVAFGGPDPYSLAVPLPVAAGFLTAGYWAATRLHVRGTVAAVATVAGVASAGAFARGTFAPIVPDAAGAVAAVGPLVGLSSVIVVQLLFAANARRGLLRDRERDALLAAADAQAARLRELNERLSLQTLEIADQAAELERQRDVFEVLARELAEERTWQEAVLAQMPVGAMLVDAKLRVTARNRRFDELMGLRPDDAIADVAGFGSWPLHQPDGTRLSFASWPMVRAMAEGRAVHAEEIAVGRAGGGTFVANVSASPVFGADGQVLGGVLLLSDLSAVREAERAAKVNEERLRFALHAGRLIAWEWELDTRVVKRSEPLETRLGLAADPKYATAGTLMDRLHPDDRDAILENQRQILAGEIGFSAIEYRIRHENGDYVSFESRGEVLRDEAGRPTRVMGGILIDVTDRRRAEERLRLLESAVVHAHDAIIVLEAAPASGRGRAVLYVNAAFTRITGYAAAEVVGRSLHFLGGEKTDAETLDRLRAALEHGTRFGGELLNYRKDGSQVWVDVSIVPVAAPGRGPTHFVMIQRDITDRKATEAALARSENLFRGIFESASAGVALTDTRGVYASCNPAFADLLGRPVEEVLGRYPIDFTHPDDADTQAPHSAALAAGRIDRYQVRKRYIRPGAAEVWAELSVSAVRGHDGELLYGLGVAVDVTARMKLEEQLRQAQKMEALGQLAGGVAHDFNNLLTAVVGNLGLVRLPATDPNRPLLRTVELAAVRAADLTRKLLGYARRNQILVAPVAPADLFAEATDILRPTLDPRITIRTAVLTATAVQADASLLVQALMNLCLNARDAMPAGGDLTLTAEDVDVPPSDPHPDAKPGRHVRLTIADTGTGMNDAVLARLFEPFFTTKGVGRGTGLGLPMVLGILQQHGGWVDVTTDIGRGSRFDLYLPVAKVPAAGAIPRLDPRLPEPDPEPVVETGTILLVDDEPMIRQLGRTVLETGGYTVVEAEDGREAVDRFVAADAGFDLVILDVTMPRLNGRDAYREILAHDPAARVLFSSGYSAEDLSELEGAKGLLSKPYRPADLLAAVRQALTEAPELAAV